MSTRTATILIGHSHPNHDGIMPTHMLFVLENSRPGLVLAPDPILSGPPARPITWLPNVDSMLEDALLMLAIHAVKVPEIRQMAPQLLSDAKPLNLYDVISPDDQAQLHAACRAQFPATCKLAITTLDGSTLTRQLQVLERYRFEVEVCTPRYTRLYSEWLDETQVRGSLTSPPGARQP